ncbi:MAG TPA: HAD family hydrolase [Polyangiaceae bacterium]|nr:HAD family hydrolase [Polyangiaceae bacterium]
MVERTRVILKTVSPRALLERLQELRGDSAEAALAFDGDGTLWSGDVGEDLFHHAISRRSLREEALAALRRAASSGGLDTDGDANDVAKRIFDAYVAGKYPERETCEMMTWCYAGQTASELAESCREVLQQARIGERLHRELEPVLDYARGSGLRAVVVSASPRPVVEAAASLWGFAPRDIAASTAAESGGRVAPENAAAVPYAEAKVGAGRSLFGDSLWLASFGDNVFDVEMFQAARMGVAVRPKLGLRSRLPELPNVHLLET